jgi:hypothetical protein
LSFASIVGHVSELGAQLCDATPWMLAHNAVSINISEENIMVRSAETQIRRNIQKRDDA